MANIMKSFSVGLISVLLLAGTVSGFYYWYSPADSEVDIRRNDYQLISKACWFDVDWRKTIKCFYLKTPIESGEFYLPVVVIKYEAEDYRKDAVMYLQGGPGTGAGLHQEGMERWVNWFGYADLKRDLILMDPRGTGKSVPVFNCSDNGQQIRSWKKNLSLLEELQINNQSMLDCFLALQRKDINLSPANFSTKISARDVIALMQKLDYEQWNILGVSYGSRLALEIEHQSQNNHTGVKSIVLDSVYPAGFGGLQTWPQVLHDAMETFLDGCAEKMSCAELTKGIDLRSAFLNAFSVLKKSPVKISIKRWDGGAPLEFVVNDHRFMSAVFAATYDPNTWSNIASAIKSIEEQNAYQIEMDIKKLIEPYLNRNLNADFNSLAFTVVDCADNQAGSETDYLRAVNQYPTMADYTRDQWRYQPCHELKNNKPLAFMTPLLPTLILAGRHDPITPVSWAEVVHQQSPLSQLIIRDKLAHSVLATDTCLLQNLYRYFDNPIEIFNRCK